MIIIDIERLFVYVNFGREDIVVNFVWLFGNNCSIFIVFFVLLSFIFFKDGDVCDCERFEFLGCLRWWLILL